jgi:hypothetical protein
MQRKWNFQHNTYLFRVAIVRDWRVFMPEKIRLKIGRASYIQRVGDKDYLKTRSRIESVPLRKLVNLARMAGRTWRLVQEGNDVFLVVEAMSWGEEEKAIKKGEYP